MKHYIVATQHRWNVQVFRQRISRLPGGWHLVEQPETLVSALTTMAPRAIFFPHWSLKVPNEIVAEHECIAFHATDLPYGRGGTPIQNLIARGIRATLVSAFRMTEDIDEGPVYLKRPLSLEGTAEEIYLRLAGVVADMIEIIVESEPVPRPQSELTVNEAPATPGGLPGGVPPIPNAGGAPATPGRLKNSRAAHRSKAASRRTWPAWAISSTTSGCSTRRDTRAPSPT